MAAPNMPLTADWFSGEPADGRIRVLHIEDSAFDFALVEQTLVKQGLPVTCHRVADGASLRLALGSGKWDIILCDYNISGLAFSESLEIIREQQPELPAIVVSGCIGEDMAVALLRHGVSDFVLKGSLVRLGSVIRRTLQEAAERRARIIAEQLLRDSEQRLSRTLDAVDLVVWDWNLKDSRFIEAGPIASVFSRPPGYHHRSFEDFLGDIHPDDAVSVRRDMREAGDGRFVEPFSLEFRLLAGDGSVRWLKATGSTLCDEYGEPVRVLGTFRDVTGRKETVATLRERIELHDALMEAIPSPIFYKDTQGRYLARIIHQGGRA